MIQIINKFIPFKPYDAMTVWPFIFIRKETNVTDKLLNHENIHGAQQREILAISAVLAIILWAVGCGWWSLLALLLFVAIYSLAYLIRRFDGKGSEEDDYRASAFEQEAYDNESNFLYLETRKPFAWLSYL